MGSSRKKGVQFLIFIYICESKRLTTSLVILEKEKQEAQINLCRPRDLSIIGPHGTLSKGLEHHRSTRYYICFARHCLHLLGSGVLC